MTPLCLYFQLIFQQCFESGILNNLRALFIQVINLPLFFLTYNCVLPSVSCISVDLVVFYLNLHYSYYLCIHLLVQNILLTNC